jgi:hypothetical protein
MDSPAVNAWVLGVTYLPISAFAAQLRTAPLSRPPISPARRRAKRGNRLDEKPMIGLAIVYPPGRQHVRHNVNHACEMCNG